MKPMKGAIAYCRTTFEVISGRKVPVEDVMIDVAPGQSMPIKMLDLTELELKRYEKQAAQTKMGK